MTQLAIYFQVAICLFCFLRTVDAHGRLTLPVPRVGSGVYENDPVVSQSDDSFVCRHATKNPAITPATVKAGGVLTMQWDLSALHVGDCAVFITYDVELARREQKYVKIANIPDCKSLSGQRVPIQIPTNLPSGDAIIRWDWRALHVFPTIEFYVQCSDVRVEGGSGTVSSSAYSIVNPPIYPARGDEGVGFRNPWGDGGAIGDAGFFVTGPSCIDEALNSCALTSAGTRGHTGSPSWPVTETTYAPATQSPVATTTPYVTTQAPVWTTQAPSPTTACVPVSNCEGLPWCNWEAFTKWCSEEAASGVCPATWCRTATPGACGNEAWAQCGGRGFEGETCCQSGLTCVAGGEWWSGCQPPSFVQSEAKPALRQLRTQRATVKAHNAGVALIQASASLDKTEL